MSDRFSFALFMNYETFWHILGPFWYFLSIRAANMIPMVLFIVNEGVFVFLNPTFMFVIPTVLMWI